MLERRELQAPVPSEGTWTECLPLSPFPSTPGNLHCLGTPLFTGMLQHVLQRDGGLLDQSHAVVCGVQRPFASGGPEGQGQESKPPVRKSCPLPLFVKSASDLRFVVVRRGVWPRTRSTRPRIMFTFGYRAHHEMSGRHCQLLSVHYHPQVRAPFNSAPPGGGGGHTTHPLPLDPQKDWAEFSSGPLAPIRFDQQFSSVPSAPLKTHPPPPSF